jgi:replicative DNA helicase
VSERSVELESDELPAVVEAEQSVLAAMLLDADAIDQAMGTLDANAFYRLAHAKLFEAIVALRAKGVPVDVITVADELRLRRDFEVVGAELLAQVMEYATTAANVVAHAEIVREQWLKRQVGRLALALQQGVHDPGSTAADLVSVLKVGTTSLERSQGRCVGGRFADAALTGPDLRAANITAPRSLLGDGVLTAGGFGMVYGKPGLGKSWLLIGLALSLVRGEQWLGLETPGDGARVGLLQLELNVHAMQARLGAFGVGDHERDAGLLVACYPNLRHAVDLCEPGQISELRQWITTHELDVLAIDALSRAHSASENKAEELGPVLGAIDSLRRETGCAILLVHHERKTAPGSTQEDDRDALRGSSRLQSDPTLLVRVKQTTGGLRCVTFVKVTEGPTPETIYYRLDDEGLPQIVDAPAKADANLERVCQAVLGAPSPTSVGQLESVVKLSRATVKRHLAALVRAERVAKIGDGKDTKYVPPTGSPAQPAHRAGPSLISTNSIGDSGASTGSGSARGDSGATGSPAQPAPLKGEPGSEPVEPVPAPRVPGTNREPTHVIQLLIDKFDAVPIGPSAPPVTGAVSDGAILPPLARTSESRPPPNAPRLFNTVESDPPQMNARKQHGA